ncbi:DUF819 family protein [Neisseria iguanae]|uniref:DUF819 family protein n=1 Tax=Neisseria iguanae TaxID=90242 RepID=UPI001FE9A8E2|nr:DUF819 family protein [Neisseria iguanae]
MAVTLAVGKLFEYSIEEVVLACNANIGSPATGCCLSRRPRLAYAGSDLGHRQGRLYFGNYRLDDLRIARFIVRIQSK